MKFLDLKNKYLGTTIGVLGSGPSLSEYKTDINSLCDLVIACNGSLNSLKPDEINLDFFVYIDLFSQTRDWFLKSDNFAKKKSIIRLVPSYLIPFDKYIVGYDSTFLIEDLRTNVKRTIQKQREDIFNKFFDNYLNFVTKSYDKDSEILLRREFELFRRAFQKYSLPETIDLKDTAPLKLRMHSNKMANLYKGEQYIGATVTSVGLQIAAFLGASEINLFGCDFNNFNGQTYAKGNNCVFYGKTSSRQRERMDARIRTIQNLGIPVNHYGNTTLEAPNRK